MATTTTLVPLPNTEAVNQSGAAQHDGRGVRRHLSAGQSVVRGVVANFSAQPITWAASLIGATVVPRYLGSEGLGQLAMVFSVTGLASAALDLGLVAYLVRRIAQDPRRVRHDLGVALLIQAVGFSVGALVIAIVAPYAVPSTLDMRLLYLALVAMVFGSAQALFLAALRGLERHTRFAWLGATPSMGSAVFCVLALVLGGDLLVYMVVGVTVDVASTLFTWRVSGLRPVLPTLNSALAREARAFVQGGFPFLSVSLTSTVYGGIDRLMLGVMVPATQLGWYAAASRIIGIPVFIPVILVTVLFPALSRSVNETDTIRRAMAQAVRGMLVLTVPLSAGICVVAPVIPRLLGWPADFDNSVPLLMILSSQLPIVAVDMMLGTVVMATGGERAWVAVGLVATVVNIGGNLVAIPFFDHLVNNGSIGASIMTLVTEIAMFIGAILLIPKHLFDKRLPWQAIQIILAAIAASLVAVELMPIALVVAALGGAVTYLVLIVMLRVVSMDDVEFVKTRLSRASR